MTQSVVGNIAVEIYAGPDDGVVLGLSRLGFETLGSADPGLAWREILCDANALSFRRGGGVSGASSVLDTGYLSITLVNKRDPLFDPSVLPNVPIRVRTNSQPSAQVYAPVYSSTPVVDKTFTRTFEATSSTMPIWLRTKSNCLDEFSAIRVIDTVTGEVVQSVSVADYTYQTWFLSDEFKAWYVTDGEVDDYRGKPLSAWSTNYFYSYSYTNSSAGPFLKIQRDVPNLVVGRTYRMEVVYYLSTADAGEMALEFGAGLEAKTLFTGRLEDIRTTYDKEGNSFVTLSAVDAVRELANTPRYGAFHAAGWRGDTFYNRVNSLAAGANVPVDPYGPAYNPAASTVITPTTTTGWSRWGTNPVGVTPSPLTVNGDSVNLITNPRVTSIGALGATANNSTLTLDGTFPGPQTNLARNGASPTHNGVLIGSPTSNDSSFSLGGDTGGMRLGMQAGKTYTVSAKGSVRSAVSGTAHARANKIVVFYRSGSSGAYTEVSSAPVGTSVQTGTNGTRVSATFTLPAGTTEAFIRFYHGYANGSTSWGLFRLSENITPGVLYDDYFWGGGGNGLYNFYWNGTPDASTSRREGGNRLFLQDEYVPGSQITTFTARERGVSFSMSGLTVGATYTVNLVFYLQFGDALLKGDKSAREYVLGYDQGGQTYWGTPVRVVPLVEAPGTITTYGTYASVAFRATSSTQVFRFTRDYTGALDSGAWTYRPENVWISNTRAYRITTAADTLLPLQDVNYESNVRSHLQMAADSAGADWWVTERNTIAYRPRGATSPIKLRLSDKHSTTDPLHTCFTNLDGSYDTKNLVNILELENHGRREDPEKLDNWLVNDAVFQYSDTNSVSLYNARASKMHVCLPEHAIASRATQTLDKLAEAEFTIASMVVDPLKEPLVLGLELFDRVNVQFRTLDRNYVVIGIEHAMTPQGWKMTLKLRKE